MSQENVELIRMTIEASNRGEWEKAAQYLHPEVQYHTYARSPEAGVYKGPEAVVEYIQKLFEDFEKVEHGVEEVIAMGDHVVLILDQRAWPKGSSEPVEQLVAELWTIRDGLLAERHSFSTKSEAFEAAGLSE
jgi:ketosteroid isomerase-like protein